MDNVPDLTPREPRNCLKCKSRYVSPVKCMNVMHPIAKPSSVLDVTDVILFQCVRCGTLCDFVTMMVVRGPQLEPTDVYIPRAVE